MSDALLTISAGWCTFSNRRHYPGHFTPLKTGEVLRVSRADAVVYVREHAEAQRLPMTQWTTLDVQVSPICERQTADQKETRIGRRIETLF